MYYLFKVERCDAINLLSKHETFEDALAAMKESLAKKIKETKGFSITADDLTPENADKYSFEFDTDPSSRIYLPLRIASSSSCSLSRRVMMRPCSRMSNAV